MARVVIIKSFIKRFRLPFYRHLRHRLADRGVELRVVFGQGDRFHAADTDIVSSLPLGVRTHNRYFYFDHTSLAWQPAWGHLRGANLVVVQQGNRHLLNHLLLLSHRAMGFKLAFWGHAKNFQSSRASGLRERIKRVYTTRVDYWFAYTRRSRAVLRQMGFPADRITTVQNAIDTSRLIGLYDSVTDEQVNALRAELGMQDQDVAAVYCGRFYGLKDVDFMLRCADKIHAANPRFHLILMGDGCEVWKVKRFCHSHDRWAHYVGARYGLDKVRYFRLATCQIMPGAVGLGIVDSLALLTPLITRQLDRHGPEIDYLRPDVNGMITPASAQAYTRGVLACISSRSLQQHLVRGCVNTRSRYTIENMAGRFAEGVCRALAMKPYVRRQRRIRKPVLECSFT